MKYRQVENRQFSSPPVFNAPADVVPLELGIGARSQKKTRVIGQMVTKIWDRFSRLDTISACDGQTERQTDRHLTTAKSTLCRALRE